MGEFDDMPVLFDLGITEEGMLSIALPTMDETGFALHMVGFYEIEATDKSSGVILFTQYDWEWDEIGEEFEIQYSELTANSVKVVCENVFGVAEAITLARVDSPYEILPPGGGESPEGPIANGGYWFVNSGKAMAPMAEDATSGMLPAKDLINYASTVKNTFTFTYDADMSYYTIQAVIPVDEIVREGRVQTGNRKVYERSQRLRLAAIDNYMHDGKLYCDCCGFEFSAFYGNRYGVSCIEIHHIKPLFMYEDDDIIRTVEQCLPNLIPVCPNCHRVIHKNHIGIDELPVFKQTIQHVHV